VKSRGVVEPVHVWDLAAEFVAEVIPEFARAYVRAAVSQCPNLGERDTGVWFSGRSGVSNQYLDFRTSGL
jgi:hypothetical protein